jgi:hypothetical protein
MQKNLRAIECVEKVRDRIDTEMLGIVDKDSFLRGIIGTYYSYNKFSSLQSLQEITQTLGKVESYISLDMLSEQQDYTLVLKALTEKHRLVANLINAVVNDEVKQLYNVTGYTVDQVFNKTIVGLSPAMNSFMRKKNLDGYKQKIGLTDPIPTLPFDKEEEIHFIPLSGHKEAINLEEDKLLMSSDSKYLRAIDGDGNVTMWDMKSGNIVRDIDMSSIEWARYDEQNYYCKRERVIDKKHKYCATIGISFPLASRGIHDIRYKVEQQYAVPVIMLLVRPTIASYICQEIFYRSKGDKKALKALQRSETFEKVKGFPATNLKYLIEQELLKIRQAKL